MSSKLANLFSNKAYKVVCYCIISFFVVFSVFSFVTLPLAGDIKVFMAAANQVQYQESGGLLAVFEAWELKGIGNRLLMYCVYALSCTIVDFGNNIAFEIVAKSFYALFVTFVSVVSACLITHNSRNRMLYICVALLAFFGTATISQMQAEMTCAALCLLITSCLVRNERWSLILAGFLGSTLVFFKSVLLVMLPVAFLASLVCLPRDTFKKKKPEGGGLLPCLGSFVACEVILAVGVWVIYPQEYVDMIAASAYQSTLLSNASDVDFQSILNSFIDHLNRSFVAIPAILAGLIFSGLLFSKWKREKDCRRIIYMASCWLLVAGIIVMSNKYFIYHYFSFVAPSVIGVYLFLTRMHIRVGAVALAVVLSFIGGIVWNTSITVTVNDSVTMCSVVTLAAFALALMLWRKLDRYIALYSVGLLTACFAIWCFFVSPLSAKYKNLVELEAASVEISSQAYPEDWAEEPILLLDDGVSTFYKSAPSDSRYFFNLPMQRWKEGDDWDLQEQEYASMMDYSGKYILYQPWFRLARYPELASKISQEYELLPNSAMFYYSPDVDQFSLMDIPTQEQIEENPDAYILIRKDESLKQ